MGLFDKLREPVVLKRTAVRKNNLSSWTFIQSLHLKVSRNK